MDKTDHIFGIIDGASLGLGNAGVASGWNEWGMMRDLSNRGILDSG